MASQVGGRQNGSQIPVIPGTPLVPPFILAHSSFPSHLPCELLSVVSNLTLRWRSHAPAEGTAHGHVACLLPSLQSRVPAGAPSGDVTVLLDSVSALARLSPGGRLG